MLYHVTIHVIMIHHIMQCYTLYCSRNTLLHQSYVVLCIVTPHICSVVHCCTPYINVWMVLCFVTPCYAVLHPILRQKLQCCVVLHLIYLCYTVLCNVSPCFAAEIHCYTNDVWCYAVLHLIYHTVVGIIHPVQLCLEREIQTHILAEGRFAWPCTLPPGGVKSKNHLRGDDPRTLPE